MFLETVPRSMQKMKVLQTAHRNICSVQRASLTLQLCTLLRAPAGLGTLSPQGQALALQALHTGVGIQVGRPGCWCIGGSLQCWGREPAPAPLTAMRAHTDLHVGKQDPTPAISLLQATDYKPTLPLLWHQCCSQTTVLPTCSHLSYRGAHSSTADPAPWHPPAGLQQFYAPSPVHFLSNNLASSFT